MKKLFLATAFIFGITVYSFGQTYTLNANLGTITGCTGTFVDGGGSGGNYASSSSYSVTFCSGSTSKIRVAFSSFSTELNYDFLHVYDGPTTSSPELANSPYHGSLGALTVESTGTCLTFTFISDGTTTAAGWLATISCFQPCQLIQSVTGVSSPAAVGNYIDICQGGSVTLTASGSYPQNGTYYTQSDATSSFHWTFGDGTSANGQTVNHTYANAGGENIDLTITDINGCISTNDIDVRLRVSTTPIFSGTNANPMTVCTGQNVTLTGQATPVHWQKDPGQTQAGLTYLPDGSGTSYTTPLNFSDFNPGQTLTDVNDITNICMNMEHSYLGDLSIAISCPNGQSVTLKSYPGGSNCFLGEPIDDDANIVSCVGYDYCFNNSPTYGTMVTESTLHTQTFTDCAGTTQTSHLYLPSGSYTSASPLTGLVGCPLNGAWTITITDNMASDNGYVFSWGMDFNPLINPTSWGFTPTIASQTWSGPGITPPTASTTIVTPSSSGSQTFTYSVTDNMGCTYDTTVTILVNPGPTVTVNSPTICSGSTATLTANGATTYNWSNSLGTGNPKSVSPASTIVYTVTGTTTGCTGTANATVTVNPTPIATATPSTQSFCTGGITSINLTSTAPGTIFAWTASTSGSITGFSNGSGNTISQTLLNSGTISGTVTYVITPTANSCVGLPINVVITVNPNPTANAGTDQIICVGQCANLTAFGGNSYLWSNSALTPNTNVCPLITTLYTVTVTDANNCSGSDDVQVTVNPLPTADAGLDQSICSGNSTNLSASGGTIYAWSPPTGLTNTSVSNPTANPTLTTTYIVTVTDNNACSASDQMVLTVNSLPVANAGSDQTICDGASASLLASGGNTYQWSPASGLSNTAVSNPSANPTSSTTYTVTVSSGVNCSATDDVTVNVNPIPTSVFSVTSPVCVGSNSLISYTGSATAGASYVWDFNGGTISSGSGQGPYQVSWSTSGTHNVSLTVTENNCVSTLTTIPVVVDKVVASLAITNPVSCYGFSDGEVTVSQTGTAPYTYSWDPLPSGTSGQIASGLAANILYSVTVTDTYGCQDIKTITLSEPLPLSMTFSTQNVVCYGQHNGSANASVSGGTLSYSYAWSASCSAGNVSSVSTLPAGMHGLTVTDANGCSIDTGFTISQPPLLSYSYTTQNVTCNSGQDGSINIDPSGGTYPLAFAWSPAIPGDSIASALASNTYNVTITDNSGCDTTLSVFISQPTQIVLSTSGNDTICNGQSITISANATGGNGSYIFTWDNSLGTGSSQLVSPLVTTTYTVNVSDINGCSTAPKSLTVFVNPVLSVTLNASPLAICNGGNATLTAQASGGNGNYTYTWDNGLGIAGNQITVYPTTTTTYVVIVSDNCNTPVATDDITITVYPLPVIAFTADPLSGCVPLSVTFTDNTTPAIQSWTWDFGNPASGSLNISHDSSPTHIFNEAGTYSVSLDVTTTDGCPGSYTHNNMIEVYPKPYADFSTYPETGSYDNPSILFIDLSSNASSWNWNFGDSLSLSNVSTETSPLHLFSNAGTYTVWLIVESPHGCIDSTSKDIYIKADFGIFFPNAFTPNGDGDNDGFFPQGYGIDLNNYELYIFDRWGEEIFHTNDFYEPWRGKVKNSSGYAQIAVYTWICVVKDVNGETYNLSGRVTLVR
jgi:gliding motility-associated-like protein